jgi:hypothetical protein
MADTYGFAIESNKVILREVVKAMAAMAYVRHVSDVFDSV